MASGEWFGKLADYLLRQTSGDDYFSGWVPLFEGGDGFFRIALRTRRHGASSDHYAIRRRQAVNCHDLPSGGGVFGLHVERLRLVQTATESDERDAFCHG